MIADLPRTPACDNNQGPILAVLQALFADRTHVLEVGSGTGQHSAYFAPFLHHLTWQTSELPERHDGIAAWHTAHPSANLRPPLEFDLSHSSWPEFDPPFDAVFSANTAHIVSWPLVERLFALAGVHLPEGGLLALYGPFNVNGQFTSEGNRSFDAMLRQRDPASGIRDVSDLQLTAHIYGMQFTAQHLLPANNRILVFRRIPRTMG